jgi:hypothetical protein
MTRQDCGIVGALHPAVAFSWATPSRRCRYRACLRRQRRADTGSTESDVCPQRGAAPGLDLSQRGTVTVHEGGRSVHGCQLGAGKCHFTGAKGGCIDIEVRNSDGTAAGGSAFPGCPETLHAWQATPFHVMVYIPSRGMNCPIRGTDLDVDTAPLWPVKWHFPAPS